MIGNREAIAITEGLVFLFRERRTSIFSSRRLGIGKILSTDPKRQVAHIRIYLQTEDRPRIQINHLPITLKALGSSIKETAGIQPGPLDDETANLIRNWENKFDEKLAAAFTEVVFSARDYALDSIGVDSMKAENAAILSSYPVRGSDGRYTRVETLVGQISGQA